MMRRVGLPAIAACALALLALPGVAAGVPPSSDPSISDYQEGVPGPGGQPSNEGGGPGGGGGGAGGPGGAGLGGGLAGGADDGSAPTQSAEQTASQVPSEEALSDLVEPGGSAAGADGGQSAAGGEGSRNAPDRSGSGGALDPAAALDAAGSGGVVVALGEAIGSFFDTSDSETGLGVLFPLLLAGAILATAAVLFARRQRG